MFLCFYVSNVGSFSSPMYKKRTKNEMKAVQKKRRSGGKDLIYSVHSINKLITLFIILNNHKIKKIYLCICENAPNFLYMQMHLQRLLNEHSGHKKRKMLY